MAKDNTRHYSRSDIKAMKKRGKVRATPVNAPTIDLGDAFWQKARIVETRRKASVHLRLDPNTLDFYRMAGRGHLTRTANILKAYAESREQPNHIIQ